MQPDNPNHIEGTEVQLTPEQQAMKGAIDKLKAKDAELGGHLVLALGSADKEFLMFRHTGEEFEYQTLLATLDGFKLVDSSSTDTRGFAGAVAHMVQQSGNPAEWMFDNQTGLLKTPSTYYTDRHPNNKYVAKLIDAESLDPEVLKGLIKYNTRMAEEAKNKALEPVTPTSTSSQITSQLDDLLG